MRLVECIQGSVEWLNARAGKVTGSRIKDVLAQIKSGEAASRRDYRVELVCEILTGEPTPQGFISRDMEWGTANEPFARGAVEVARGYMVDQVGFVLHPTMDRAGVSPDGLVNWMAGDEAPEGIVEIKCPKTATHLGYILAGVVPSDYQPQMLWEMACTGAKWCDFVSYDPRLPEHLQLFVARFNRDEARIAAMESEVARFNAEVDAMLAGLPKAPEPEEAALERRATPAPVAAGVHGNAGDEAVPL